MMTTRIVRIACAIHGVLLRFVPGIPRGYRPEMADTFEAAAADAAQRGSWAVCCLLFHEFGDLVTARRADTPRSIDLPAEAAAPTYSGIAWIDAPAWRQAWRSLARRPAFFLTTVLTLAAGTAVITAVFSLVDTVLIRPLPYPDADRLVTLYESSPAARERTSLVAPGRLEDWGRLSRSFVAVSGTYSESVTDTSGETPERLNARRVAPRFFEVYAATPLDGRTFTADEERWGGPAAAVISSGFWSRRFNRDRRAIGHSLTIGGRTYPIVGVMPSAFADSGIDVWLPAQTPSGILQVREARFFGGIARLRPGVSLEAGTADLVAVQAALAKQFPKTDGGWSVIVTPLKEARIGDATRGIVLVLAAVGVLWVVVVANIAGLMLVQAHRRTRELALRAALGASRTRMMTPLVREGLTIGTAGGALGAALAVWLVALARGVLKAIPRIDELTLDWRMLTFAAGTALLGALTFSLVPAALATRTNLARTIAAAGRSATGRHHMQKALVVGQVALSVLLVWSAALLLRSYQNLGQVETGFDPSGTITFRVGARWDEDRTAIGRLQQQLLERLERLPHVQAAGLTSFLPVSGATLRYQVRVDGLTGPNADGTMTVGVRTVSAGYLRAIRVPLLAGGWCSDLHMDLDVYGRRTPAARPRLILVNRRFVDAHASGQDLTSRQLRFTDMGDTDYTIAGVIGDVSEDSHAADSVPYVYVCSSAGEWPDPNYVVRTAAPATFASDLRRIVRELDPERAIFALRPLDDVIDDGLERPRLDAAILGLFAAAAVTLAALGLYSLFMLVVAERGKEMAVRLALGAAPGQLVHLVMGGASQLLAVGLVLGGLLTILGDRLLRGLLFDVSPLDPVAIAVSAATLAVVSVAAAAGPAIRASRVAPVEALRAE